MSRTGKSLSPRRAAIIGASTKVGWLTITAHSTSDGALRVGRAWGRERAASPSTMRSVRQLAAVGFDQSVLVSTSVRPVHGDVLPLGKVVHPQVPCLSNSTVVLSNDEIP